MFQTNNDKDDVGDFEPFLLDYINEGYDTLLYDSLSVHVGDTSYPLLEDDTDEPELDAWIHGAIADYATYRVYLNGSAAKQNRGFLYLSRFNKAKSALTVGTTPAIVNIPE